MDFKCNKCKEIFAIKKEYDEHVKLEECVIYMYIDKDKYKVFEKVPYFSKLYSFKQNMSGDNIEVFVQKDKIYQCKFCDGIFSRVDSLSRHTKKFCKVKKELEDLKEKNPHLDDERPPKETDLGDFDVEDFKEKFDILMQNYITNRKS
jgi:uncharacterized C2H2 Zn-finger protein